MTQQEKDQQAQRRLRAVMIVAADMLDVTQDEWLTHAQKNGAIKLVAKWLRQKAENLSTITSSVYDDIPF